MYAALSVGTGNYYKPLLPITTDIIIILETSDNKSKVKTKSGC